MLYHNVSNLRKRIRDISYESVFEPESHVYTRVRDSAILKSSTGVTKMTQPVFETNKWLLYKAAQATWNVKPKEIWEDDKNYWLVRPEMTVLKATHGALPTIKIPIWRDFEKALEVPVFGEHIKRLQNEWHSKGVVGRDQGTQAHLYGEHLWMNRPRKAAELVEAYPEYRDAFRPVERFWLDWKTKLYPIAVECRVHSNVWPVAGTFDMLAIDRKGKVVLVDYKTDREVATSKYDYCLPPLSHLRAGTLAKYSLQLGLYATLLREHGVHVSSFLIVHLKAHRTGVFADYETHDKLIATHEDVVKMLDAFA